MYLHVFKEERRSIILQKRPVFMVACFSAIFFSRGRGEFGLNCEVLYAQNEQIVDPNIIVC